LGPLSVKTYEEPRWAWMADLRTVLTCVSLATTGSEDVQLPELE
jgi:hypothetical protein